MDTFGQVSAEEVANLQRYGTAEAPRPDVGAPPELGTRPEPLDEPGHALYKDTGPFGKTVVPTEEVPVERERPVTPPPDGKYQAVSKANSTPSQFAREKNLNTDESWFENPVAILGAIADGVLWGWADEAMAATMAGLGEVTGTGDYAELYDKYFDSAQAARDAYADEHPYIDFLGNVVGGIMSGGPVVGLAKGIAKSAIPQAAKLASYAGIMAGEGAVAGAGSSKGDRLEDAAYGAGGGLVLGGLLSGAGTGVRKLAERNKAMDRLDQEPFKPLVLAAEKGGVRNSLYKWLVGASWGGRTRIREQVDTYMQQYKDALATADGELLEMTSKLTTQNRHLKKARVHAEQAQNSARLRAEKLAKAKARKDTRAIQTLVKEDLAAQKAMAVSQQKDALDSANAKLRDAATAQSYPAAMDTETRRKLMASDASARQSMLQYWWTNTGFSLARGKTSSINVNKMLENVMSTIDDVGGLSPEGRDALLEMLDPAVTAMSRGKVTGEEFLAARTALSKAAGGVPSSTADANSVSYALRKVLGVIDDSFADGVADKGFKKSWRKEKEYYRNYLIGTDAAAAARNNPIRGEYTTKQWIDAAKSNSSTKEIAANKAPLQKLAGQLDSSAQEVAAQMAKDSDELLKRIDDLATNKLRTIEDDLDKEIARLKATESRAKAQREVQAIDTDAAKASADRKQLSVLEAHREDIQRAIKEMDDKGPIRGDSIFVQQIATSFLWAVSGGTLLGGGSGVMLGLGGGAAMAKMLSTPRAQKMLAMQMNLSPRTVKVLTDVAEANLEKTRRSTARAGVLAENTGEDDAAF